MSEADPHLSELRRAILDTGLDLTWEIRLLPPPKDWNLLEGSRDVHP